MYQPANSPQYYPLTTYFVGGLDEERGVSNLWETRFGWRVDVEAAVAYLFGPISALALLILETNNDYVRFHGQFPFTCRLLFY
jgi:hypothetical protein